MHGHFNISDLSEHECREVVDRLGLLKWLDSFAVGDDEMDRQHHRFLNLAAQVPVLIEGKAPVAEVRAAVRAMHEDTVNHFVSEEALLSEIAFPGLDRHRVAHQDILYSFAELEKSLDGIDDVHKLGAMAHRIIMTILEHILGEDMLYKSCLMRSRGL